MWQFGAFALIWLLHASAQARYDVISHPAVVAEWAKASTLFKTQLNLKLRFSSIPF